MFDFFSIPVTPMTYCYSVIPVILMVWIMSYIEKFVDKITPRIVKLILHPTLVIIISAPIAIIAIGPLGGIIGDGLAIAIDFLSAKLGFVIVGILAATFPFIVMTGMHHALTPIGLNAVATGGDTLIFVSQVCSNVAQSGASLAVAESPASAYNPLFLYGGVGLGKTHLMHAIGNEVLFNNKSLKVLYVTSERFTNEFIDALKSASTEKFRQKYRNIDILLIDDIQFIAGKERLQEEFFHTFNTLHESGKQIVISSDRPPRDIPLLEDRLKSRFEWGLLADVSMADYETRLAILRKKKDEKHLIVDDEILSNIAAKIDSNIRELEGVFNKLVAKSSLTHTPITMEMAEKAINDIIMQKASVISIEYIQEMICKYFNITMKDLKSSQRSNDIAYPRQIGMYLCRILTNESFPKIGEAFGKRDHTTVMHGYKKIEQEIKQNPESNTKLIVESVKKIILSKEN